MSDSDDDHNGAKYREDDDANSRNEDEEESDEETPSNSDGEEGVNVEDVYDDWAEYEDVEPLRISAMLHEALESGAYAEYGAEPGAERTEDSGEHHHNPAFELVGPCTFYVGGFSALRHLSDALSLIACREDEVALLPALSYTFNGAPQLHPEQPGKDSSSLVTVIDSTRLGGVTIRHAFLDSVKAFHAAATLPPRALSCASTTMTREALRELLRGQVMGGKDPALGDDATDADGDGGNNDGEGGDEETDSADGGKGGRAARANAEVDTLDAELREVSVGELIPATFAKPSKASLARVAEANNALLSNQAVQLLSGDAISARFLAETEERSAQSSGDVKKALQQMTSATDDVLRRMLPAEVYTDSKQVQVSNAARTGANYPGAGDEDVEDGGEMESGFGEMDGAGSANALGDGFPHHAFTPSETLSSYLIGLYGIPMPQIDGTLRIVTGAKKDAQANDSIAPLVRAHDLGLWTEHNEKKENDDMDDDDGDAAAEEEEHDDEEHGNGNRSQPPQQHQKKEPLPRTVDYAMRLPAWRWFGHDIDARLLEDAINAVAADEAEEGGENPADALIALQEKLANVQDDASIIAAFAARKSGADGNANADQQQEYAEEEEPDIFAEICPTAVRVIATERRKEWFQRRVLPPVCVLGLRFSGGCVAEKFSTALFVECALGTSAGHSKLQAHGVGAHAFTEVDFVSCMISASSSAALYCFPKAQPRFFSCSISGNSSLPQVSGSQGAESSSSPFSNTSLLAPPPFLPPLLPSATYRMRVNAQCAALSGSDRSTMLSIPPEAMRQKMKSGSDAVGDSGLSQRAIDKIVAAARGDKAEDGEAEEEQEDEEDAGAAAGAAVSSGTGRHPYTFDASGRPLRDLAFTRRGERMMKREVTQLLPLLAAATTTHGVAAPHSQEAAAGTGPAASGPSSSPSSSSSPGGASGGSRVGNLNETVVAVASSLRRAHEDQLEMIKATRSGGNQGVSLRKQYYNKRVAGRSTRSGVPVVGDSGNVEDLVDIMDWFNATPTANPSTLMQTALGVQGSSSAPVVSQSSRCRTGVYSDNADVVLYFCTISSVDVGLVCHDVCEGTSLYACRFLQCFQIGLLLLAKSAAHVENCLILSASPSASVKPAHPSTGARSVGTVLPQHQPLPQTPQAGVASAYRTPSPPPPRQDPGTHAAACSRAALYVGENAHPHLERNIFVGLLAPDPQDRQLVRASRKHTNQRPIVPVAAQQGTFPFVSVATPSSLYLRAAQASPSAEVYQSTPSSFSSSHLPLFDESESHATVVLRCSSAAIHTGLRENIVLEYDAANSSFRERTISATMDAAARMSAPLSSASLSNPANSFPHDLSATFPIGKKRAELPPIDSVQRGFQWINGVY